MQRHLPAYYAVDACSMIFLAAVDVACAAWMLELWQEEANMFMLIMSLAGTIGQTVSQFDRHPIPIRGAGDYEF